MPPAPGVREQLKQRFTELRSRAGDLVGHEVRFGEPHHVGLNDGLIFPGPRFPLGTTARVARRAALDRAPLRGSVRVVVVLVDFADRPMVDGTAERFRELFFSTGALPHGSVTEYFADASGGLLRIDGEVVGPYRMPQSLARYVGDQNGLQEGRPNAQTLADDALTAAEPAVDFTPYDNDGNGYVDAFIVVHAGTGAEATGAAGDIWSHKWVLPAEREVDGTRVYGYLTIPEDARIGVCAHELGHLVFGWPDLYDTDGSSEGVGNWCLMGSGSWGLDGERPTHPSAWCKANQGWVQVVAPSSATTVTIDDVKAARTVYRLWTDGAAGDEYFLVENRPRTGYDASLPGEGLLIWHIDDAVATNRDERHYKVALMQADGRRGLETSANRGDDGDAYPGSTANTLFDDGSTPSSRSYGKLATGVAVTDIPAASPSMTVQVRVGPAERPAGTD